MEHMVETAILAGPFESQDIERFFDDADHARIP
jgi:hypothetical protein